MTKNTRRTKKKPMRNNTVLKPMAAAAAAIPLLFSCQTHYANYFYDKAETRCYVARNNSAKILSDGTHYYLEAERMRYKDPSVTAMGSLKSLLNTPTGSFEPVDNVRDLHRLSPEYAQYLIGKRRRMPQTYTAEFVADSEEIRTSELQELPVITGRLQNNAPRSYTVTSPYSLGYNTLGVATTLLVDVPLTCVGTAFCSLLYTEACLFGLIFEPAHAVVDGIASDFGFSQEQDHLLPAPPQQ